MIEIFYYSAIIILISYIKPFIGNKSIESFNKHEKHINELIDLQKNNAQSETSAKETYDSIKTIHKNNNIGKIGFIMYFFTIFWQIIGIIYCTQTLLLYLFICLSFTAIFIFFTPDNKKELVRKLILASKICVTFLILYNHFFNNLN